MGKPKTWESVLRRELEDRRHHSGFRRRHQFLTRVYKYTKETGGNDEHRFWNAADCLEARNPNCLALINIKRLKRCKSMIYRVKQFDPRGRNLGVHINSKHLGPPRILFPFPATPPPPPPSTPPPPPPPSPPSTPPPPPPPSPPSTPPPPPPPPSTPPPPPPPTSSPEVKSPSPPPDPEVPDEKKQKKMQINELNVFLTKKTEELMAASKASILCKSIKALKAEAKRLAQQCAERGILEADLLEFHTESDRISAEQHREFQNVQQICGSGAIPKVAYTCTPVNLPKLDAPRPDNLGKIPPNVNKSALPPIVWHSRNLCLETPEPIEQRKPQDEAEMADIENLRKACLLFKQSHSVRVCESPAKDVKPEDGEHDTDDANEKTQNERRRLREEIDRLTGHLGELKVRIHAAKSSTQGGTRRILQLCVSLKERERLLVECTEMICSILDGRRSASDKIMAWKTAQLRRYVEFYRWQLIRLNHEKAAQDTEIRKLEDSHKAQEAILQECVETTRRFCGDAKNKRKATKGLDFCTWDYDLT